MLRHHLKTLPLPQSLRWQSRVALGVLMALIVAGSLITIYALSVSSNATRRLTEERMRHMQEAENMVQRTLLIDRETERLMSATSPDEIKARYGEIVQQMDALDHVVENLSRASADVSVLNLQHSAQMFRNAAIIVVELRTKELQSPTNNNAATMLRFHEQVQHAAMDMMAAAQELSAHLTSDYHDAVRRVAQVSIRNERWVVALCFASLIIAWQVSWHFNRRVLSRLQAVSDSLRQDRMAADAVPLPVGGNDEISEMARAVQEFLKDRRRLAEAHEELEAFNYSVSHDLRAPLRAIGGFCDILMDHSGEQLDEQGRGYLEKISQSADGMDKLIKDLLAFSRMSGSPMSVEPVDLSLLVRAVFEEVRRTASDRDIVLRLGELPAARADRALIRQVLVNLLANAVKFSAGQPEAIVEVTCPERGEMNVYCIKDNGVGFDMSHASRLFAVFQRLHAGNEFEGTGLGLAIVKRIVVRHGGRVWATSKVGEGATFYFTLPAAAGEMTNKERGQPQKDT